MPGTLSYIMIAQQQSTVLPRFNATFGTRTFWRYKGVGDIKGVHFLRLHALGVNNFIILQERKNNSIKYIFIHTLIRFTQSTITQATINNKNI